jgi:hypothetical protein
MSGAGRFEIDVFDSRLWKTRMARIDGEISSDLPLPRQGKYVFPRAILY